VYLLPNTSSYLPAIIDRADQLLLSIAPRGVYKLIYEAPTILDNYANTSSAGSIIAFHKHNQGLKSGDLAVLCSFGAGYSIGSIVLRRR
jgi:hypothetical protein